MKAEYDFSKGARGKFYHPNAVFNFPVYLEPDVIDQARISALLQAYMEAHET